MTLLAAANAVPLENEAPDLSRIESSFASTLRQAPFLRSMLLLDERGRIVASSNPANVSLTVTTQDYLPPMTETLEMLCIGQPWAGRDFAGGHPATAQTPVQAKAQSFIPVTRTLAVGKRWVTLLVALNPDYFINHTSQTLDTREVLVEVLRYYGTLLIATDPNAQAGSRQAAVVRDLQLSNSESGKFEQDDSQGPLALRV